MQTGYFLIERRRICSYLQLAGRKYSISVNRELSLNKTPTQTSRS